MAGEAVCVEKECVQGLRLAGEGVDPGTHRQDFWEGGGAVD